MSAHPSLVTLAAVVITGFALAGHITLASDGAIADDAPAKARSTPLAQPSAPPATAKIRLPPRPLDDQDQIAALERIQYALNEVGDGKVYVWRRWHGGLSGVIHPTTSFKDDDGKICRYLVVLMTTGERSKRIEGIACRLPSGRWQL